MNNKFDKKSQSLSTSELKYRVQNPTKFQELAILSAEKELQLRIENNSEVNEILKINEDERKKIQKQRELEKSELEDFATQINGITAHFLNRTGAHLIDFFMTIIILWVVTFIIYFLSYNDITKQQSRQLLVIIWIVYGTLWETSSYQATPGKLIMKLKIVDKNGSTLSYKRAIARQFSKLLSSFLLGIGYLLSLYDIRKRTLHDRLSKSYVVYTKSSLKASATEDILDDDI